ncbi:MAG: hypothetical protein JNL18_22230 [Planctomycetaceae bacterium]|uniref:Uncharacterized protein n=1 Tax=Lacipirellula limnantheis TaxID=2528024 RepID=A0A517U2B4_9BACT|nr:hypothetical protein [Lacipirellula limnantheis]MBL9165461.1 hypothetical protein [Planctomycetaceae bacterium]QDT74771.1 hypothetical protein I41_39730 [Lacipirellula limnantheis]
MDTTDYPSLGRLAVLNAQLARQARLVEDVVDRQLDGVERLFRAAALSDWQAVLRISEELIAQLQDPTDLPVVRSAQQLCDLLRRDPSGGKVSVRLAELLSACRSARLTDRPSRRSS